MLRTFHAGLALLLLLSLAACRQEGKQVQGLVTQVQYTERGELTSFVVRTRSGEQVGLLLTQETFAAPPQSGSWTSSEMRAEFQKALEPDVQISAACLPAKQTLTAQDGQELTAYTADHISIIGKLNRGAAALADGTALDVLEEYFTSADRTYLLADGTELLWVRGPSGPENHFVGDLESFQDLSQRAQERVAAYYRERGPLYDEQAELEKAYADYLKKREDFQSHMVEQDVTPSASSEQVMYFRTGLTLPLYQEGGGTVYTQSLGDAFDRETGEHLELWDLFQCSREEAGRAIIDAALDWQGSGGLRASLEAAFTPEGVVVRTDSLCMCFEPGVITEEPSGYVFDADMSKLQALMHHWAVPKSGE
ncbi:hypothetical protein D1646_02050 [Pseudoflavonifractor sp. 60]|uniref:hypothetical protein n=1 Tax=Pseudoflavonifractor sp. 60 TaxID=2304576 RepID=UPI00136BE34C|nr:hypothetical protein [Pseudoflavonifractor sp. 60]NBI65609.1 hypothetical protein [Pseudoflavonifractor sp. 60]